jgi:hypothetical protein
VPCARHALAAKTTRAARQEPDRSGGNARVSKEQGRPVARRPCEVLGSSRRDEPGDCLGYCSLRRVFVVASSHAWLRSMDRVVGRFGRGQGASFLSCPRNPQAAYNPMDSVASTVLATAKSCLSCPPAADSISPQGGPSRRPIGTEIEQPSRMLIVSVLRRISRFVRL